MTRKYQVFDCYDILQQSNGILHNLCIWIHHWSHMYYVPLEDHIYRLSYDKNIMDYSITSVWCRIVISNLSVYVHYVSE